MKKNKKVALSKKPFLVLSRRAIAGWLGVIFLLCAWMFVIGILVGRGTAPVKFDIDNLQAKLGDAGKHAGPKQKGQPPSESGIVRDKSDLGFWEALPEDRQDDRIDKEKTPPVVNKKVEPPADKNPAPATGEKAAPKDKAPNKTDPETGFKKKKPAKQPVAAKSKTTPTGKLYTVQVGAFKAKNEKEADRLVAELKKQGYDAYRKVGKVKDQGIWIRVRIGKYHKRSEAVATLEKLQKAGRKPYITPYE
jgi:cell division septation protein DedD